MSNSSKEHIHKLKQGNDDDDLRADMNEFELDLDNLPPTKHNWVKRGIVMSCEGANHPSHRHFIKE